MSANADTFLIIKKEAGESSYSISRDNKSIPGYTDKMNFSEVRKFLTTTNIRFNGLKFADFDYDSERDMDIIGIFEYKFAQSRLEGNREDNYFIPTSTQDNYDNIEKSGKGGKRAEKIRGDIPEDVFYTKQTYKKSKDLIASDPSLKRMIDEEIWKN